MNTSRQRSLVIETPEGVIFSYELATPALRALAWAVDAAAIGTAAYVIGKSPTVSATSTKIGPARCPPSSSSWPPSVTASCSSGAGAARPSANGCWVCAWWMRKGLRLQFPQVALRNLLRLVDIHAHPVPGRRAQPACFTRRCQRLGDLAANTVVARERAFAEPDLEQIAPAKYNSLLAYPHLAARLRSLASPQAVGLAIQAATGRDSFAPAARLELFRDLAAYFRHLVQFPPDALEGLTDEQYVRSVLRVVMAPAAARKSPA